MDDLITELANVGVDLATAKKTLDESRAQWEADNADMIALIEALKLRQSELNDTVRQTALDLYGLTGEKKPHPAVTVKIYTVCSFDAVHGTEWARANAPYMLQLDTKEYERQLKQGVSGMPGEVSEEPRATIARDLSEYLG